MSKPKSYFNQSNTTALEVPELEFNEIKEKCNKNKTKSCFYKNFSTTGRLKTKYYMDDEGGIWFNDFIEQKKEYVEIYFKPEDEEEEEDEEYEYNAYSISSLYKVVMNVAGGGLMNGNAYANIEGEWKTEEDFNNGEEGVIYYCEYGNNPIRQYKGSRIVWGEEDNFNIE